jgi:cobalt-precorrin-5B (C1)-methyltransferase
MSAIAEGLKEAALKGARVLLTVPKGKEAASLTLNPKVGVHGGISILGSTGFVEPWNEHLTDHAALESAVNGKVILTTGRIGLRYSRMLFPDHAAVLIGSKLDRLSPRMEQESVLCGLPGLILKWADPDILKGTGFATVAEMMESSPSHKAIDDAMQKAGERLPWTRIVLIDRDGRIVRDSKPREASRKR